MLVNCEQSVLYTADCSRGRRVVRLAELKPIDDGRLTELLTCR